MASVIDPRQGRNTAVVTSDGNGRAPAAERLMKAVIHDRYGSPDVLELRDVDKPVVGDDDVLVRVRAASVNPYDLHFVAGLPYLFRLQFGPLKPKANSLGADLAGEVEAVGANVTHVRLGDEVFGEVKTGSHAQYVCASGETLALKPRSLTFEQAAAVSMAAQTALQGIRDKGRIQPGQKVLINGAAGGVGTFAVQIAKALGAEVTGVCSTRNVDMVRSIGADHVIDYVQEDFTRGGQRYDLLLDLIGNRSMSKCRRVLKPKGTYIASFGQLEHRWLGPLPRLFKMLVLSPFVSQKLVILVTKPNTEDLQFLRELIEAGKVAPVIDRTYQLRETAEAIRYVEEGHARGKVVITV